MRPLSCPCENKMDLLKSTSPRIRSLRNLHCIPGSARMLSALPEPGRGAPPRAWQEGTCPIAPPVTQKTSILVSKSTSLAYPL
jgi:hypothetical protein